MYIIHNIYAALKWHSSIFSAVEIQTRHISIGNNRFCSYKAVLY